LILIVLPEYDEGLLVNDASVTSIAGGVIWAAIDKIFPNKKKAIMMIFIHF
jgi:hypothetical protein